MEINYLFTFLILLLALLLTESKPRGPRFERNQNRFRALQSRLRSPVVSSPRTKQQRLSRVDRLRKNHEQYLRILANRRRSPSSSTSGAGSINKSIIAQRTGSTTANQELLRDRLRTRGNPRPNTSKIRTRIASTFAPTTTTTTTTTAKPTPAPTPPRVFPGGFGVPPAVDKTLGPGSFGEFAGDSGLLGPAGSGLTIGGTGADTGLVGQSGPPDSGLVGGQPPKDTGLFGTSSAGSGKPPGGNIQLGTGLNDPTLGGAPGNFGVNPAQGIGGFISQFIPQSGQQGIGNILNQGQNLFQPDANQGRNPFEPPRDSVDDTFIGKAVRTLINQGQRALQQANAKAAQQAQNPFQPKQGHNLFPSNGNPLIHERNPLLQSNGNGNPLIQGQNPLLQPNGNGNPLIHGQNPLLQPNTNPLLQGLNPLLQPNANPLIGQNQGQNPFAPKPDATFLGQAIKNLINQGQNALPKTNQGQNPFLPNGNPVNQGQNPFQPNGNPLNQGQNPFLQPNSNPLNHGINLLRPNPGRFGVAPGIQGGPSIPDLNAGNFFDRLPTISPYDQTFIDIFDAVFGSGSLATQARAVDRIIGIEELMELQRSPLIGPGIQAVQKLLVDAARKNAAKAALAGN